MQECQQNQSLKTTWKRIICSSTLLKWQEIYRILIIAIASNLSNSVLFRGEKDAKEGKQIGQLEAFGVDTVRLASRLRRPMNRTPSNAIPTFDLRLATTSQGWFNGDSMKVINPNSSGSCYPMDLVVTQMRLSTSYGGKRKKGLALISDKTLSMYLSSFCLSLPW